MHTTFALCIQIIIKINMFYILPSMWFDMDIVYSIYFPRWPNIAKKKHLDDNIGCKCHRLKAIFNRKNYRRLLTTHTVSICLPKRSKVSTTWYATKENSNRARLSALWQTANLLGVRLHICCKILKKILYFYKLEMKKLKDKYIKEKKR